MTNQKIGRLFWQSTDTTLLHRLLKEGIVDARKFVVAFNAGAKNKRTEQGIYSRLYHEVGFEGFPSGLRESFNIMLRPIKREKRQDFSKPGAPFIPVLKCMEILNVSGERIRQLGLTRDGRGNRVRKSIDPETNFVIYSKPDILAYKIYRDNRPVEKNKLKRQLELNLEVVTSTPVKVAPEMKKAENVIVRSKPEPSATPINEALGVYAKERETVRIALEAYTIGLIPLDQFIAQMHKMLVANN